METKFSNELIEDSNNFYNVLTITKDQLQEICHKFYTLGMYSDDKTLKNFNTNFELLWKNI